MKDQMRALIAGELRLPVEQLTDDLTIEQVGLDSLTFAEAVVAIEQSLKRRIDTAKVSAELSSETSISQLIAFLIDALED